MAGRAILIKSVISAIPLYYMSIFCIPKTVARKITAMQSRFCGVELLITGKFIGLLGIQWQKKRTGAVWVLGIYRQKTKLSSSSGFGN
jgi:hypothetical protein